MVDDYLAAEAPIIARLKALVPALRAVAGAPEIVVPPQVPSALVIYDGDTIPQGPGGQAGNGALQVVRQRWMVVLIVHNLRYAAEGAEARLTAGPLLIEVMRALAGWPPLPELRPMRRVQGPEVDYRDGVALFPLMYETQLLTSM
jgi:hypothetical protein